jgi:Tol biopolymer transport system component
VALKSWASNLDPPDTNAYEDIFVHDRETHITTRVSVASDGTQANGPSSAPTLSADGHYVAFTSWASNLVDGDANGFYDVFVHDRVTGMTTRVSVASDGTQANDSSFGSALSTGGRYVAFGSIASNLVVGDTNGEGDVFIYDQQTHTTTRVSLASDGTQANGGSALAVFSADGRYVAFQSWASNLVAGDTNSVTDVFIHDLQNHTTTRVSVASDGTQANGQSEKPSLSADGRYVAFWSEASSLVDGDTNDAYDVFVHDRRMHTTTRVSVAPDGTQANSQSWGSSLSADGHYVAFQSFASNLVAGDTNEDHDIFVVVLISVPPAQVQLSGPALGSAGRVYPFMAIVYPALAVMPITYTWAATDQETVTHVGGMQDTVYFSWDALGSKAITVTAQNAEGLARGDAQMRIVSVVHCLQLPLVSRNP